MPLLIALTTLDVTRFSPVCPEPGRPLLCPKDQTKLELDDAPELGFPTPDLEILSCDCGHRFQLMSVRGLWQLKDLD